MVAKLCNIWRKWVRVSSILGQEVADASTSGTFLKAFVQGVLLFGLDTWLVTPRIIRKLVGGPQPGIAPDEHRETPEAAQHQLGLPPPPPSERLWGARIVTGGGVHQAAPIA